MILISKPFLVKTAEFKPFGFRQPYRCNSFIRLMQLIMNPTQFVFDNVVLNEPVKNQIFNDSIFYRIVYSNNMITTNCIQLKMDIKCPTIEKKFNKTNVQFNIHNNHEFIASIKMIEEQLLSSIPASINKTPVYNIYNELISGRISAHDFRNIFVLKISGIWETEHNYGITYKFIGA